MKRFLTILALILFAGSAAYGATAQETIREINSLVKMNKHEEAFTAAYLAVKNDPSVAAEIRPIVAQILQSLISKATSITLEGKFHDKMQILRPLWSTILSPGASELFDSEEAYNAKVLEIYNMLIESTLERAKYFEDQNNYAQAAFYANMCVAYRPSDPDPRAVAILETAKSKSAQALTAAPLAGKEFVLSSPADDGFSAINNASTAEVRIVDKGGMVRLSFANVTIPSGARIKSAHLRGFFLQMGQGPSFIINIRPEQFENAAEAGQTKSSRVKWSVIDPPQGWLDSPDIKNVIQENIDRPDWKPGNRMNVYCDLRRGGPQFITYEQDPQRAFRLIVDW